MSYVVEEKKEVNKKNSSNNNKTCTQKQKNKPMYKQFNNNFIVVNTGSSSPYGFVTKDVLKTKKVVQKEQTTLEPEKKKGSHNV